MQLDVIISGQPLRIKCPFHISQLGSSSHSHLLALGDGDVLLQ